MNEKNVSVKKTKKPTAIKKEQAAETHSNIKNWINIMLSKSQTQEYILDEVLELTNSRFVNCTWMKF